MASSSQVIDNVVETVVVEKKTKKGKTPKVVDSVPSTSTVVSTEEQMASLVNQLSLLVKRVEVLETDLQEMKQQASISPKETAKPKKEEKEKKTRAPTAYNNFMKEKMLELKETHTSLSNIERMKMAAEAWSESKKLASS